MHKLAAPVPPLLPLELLPRRAPAGRALPPVLAARRSRRSAPTTRRSTPRRSCCSRRCSSGSAPRACGCASRASASPPTRAAYREELGRLPARARRAAWRRAVRERIELNPLRAFDSDDPRTREVMAGAPRLLDRLDADDAEHFAAVRELLDRAGRRLRDRPDARARARLLHAHASSSSRATRSARSRASAAAGATTASSSCSAARRRPGIGWAAGIERILMAAREPPPPRARARPLRRPRAARAPTPSPTLPRRARAPGLAAQMELAGRSLKGQLKQAERLGARYVAIVEGDARAPARPARRQPRRRSRATARRRIAWWRRDAAAAPRTATATAGAATCAPPTPAASVRVAGWVHRRRDHGGLIFIDLRDRSGLLQLVFHPDSAPAAHAAAHELRSEAVLSVAGELVAARRRRTSTRRSRPARSSSRSRELDVLATSPTPPFPIDEDVGVDETLRLRHRALDLRREPMRDALILRHRVVREMREVLERHDFLEIETPILTRATPEGARDFLVPVAPAARLVLRAAAVAADLQAAADDRRPRALLPDRALLPRRGPARRPPARVHAARPRDVVRHRGGRARASPRR